MTETNWQQPIIWLAGVMRPHNTEIALAMVATLLVIFGDLINGLLRRLVRQQPAWLRIAAFIGLCTFGYGAISVFLTPVLSNFLHSQSSLAYVLTVVMSFLIVGILAERFQKSK
ncbi:MAG: DUF3392 family protein [Oleispira sp.]|nr:DUF3392 family protein [Oleispira sp.]